MNEIEPTEVTSLASSKSPGAVQSHETAPDYGLAPSSVPDSSGHRPFTFPQDIPWTVLAAIGLMIVDLFLTSLSRFGRLVTDSTPGTMGTQLLLLSLTTVVYILLIWKIASRKDWARMIVLNLTLLGILLIVVGRVMTVSVTGLLMSALLLIALRTTTVVMLYMPASNRWYDREPSPN